MSTKRLFVEIKRKLPEPLQSAVLNVLQTQMPSRLGSGLSRQASPR